MIYLCILRYDKCLDDNDGKYFIFFFLIKEKEKKRKWNKR